jgi:predicted transcriptional regulator
VINMSEIKDKKWKSFVEKSKKGKFRLIRCMRTTRKVKKN